MSAKLAAAVAEIPCDWAVVIVATKGGASVKLTAPCGASAQTFDADRAKAVRGAIAECREKAAQRAANPAPGWASVFAGIVR